MGIIIFNFIIKGSLTIFILNIVIVIDFILIGGILPYLERKKLSLIQKRVGPKYVGLNGRLQFIADAMKIFFKDYFYVLLVNKYYFFLLPFTFLIYNLFFLFNFQWGGNLFLYDIEINVIFLMIFSTISNILTFLTGFFCRNKYTIITSSRTMSVFFINELLTTVLMCNFFFLAKSFSFSDYTSAVSDVGGFALWLPLLPIWIFVFLLEINKVPFDFQEAESELIMGYTNEYTGFLFGVYILIEYLHIFIYLYFFAIIF